jgi:hypothetical protein
MAGFPQARMTRTENTEKMGAAPFASGGADTYITRAGNGYGDKLPS